MGPVEGNEICVVLVRDSATIGLSRRTAARSVQAWSHVSDAGAARLKRAGRPFWRQQQALECRTNCVRSGCDSWTCSLLVLRIARNARRSPVDGWRFAR